MFRTNGTETQSDFKAIKGLLFWEIFHIRQNNPGQIKQNKKTKTKQNF